RRRSQLLYWGKLVVNARNCACKLFSTFGIQKLLMKIYFPVFIIFTLLILSACKPKKNIVYMSNNNFEQEISQARFSGLHIQEGDKLQIQVSSFDELAVRPFNRSSMSTTASA